MRSPCGVGAGFAIFQFFVGGTFRLSHGTMIIESVTAAETRQAASLRRGFSVASCFHGLLLICRVRHRFRATFSRQPRQVRKEATVTGSFVCSGSPVPGFLFCPLRSVMTKRLYYDSSDTREFDSVVEDVIPASAEQTS